MRLDDALIDTFPGAGDYAALKIHKEWSVGTGNLLGYPITPARDHDSPYLVVDERRRGSGLSMDLGYASIERLFECDMYDVQYVIRLKENWRPTVERLVRGAVLRDPSRELTSTHCLMRSWSCSTGSHRCRFPSAVG